MTTISGAECGSISIFLIVIRLQSLPVSCSLTQQTSNYMPCLACPSVSAEALNPYKPQVKEWQQELLQHFGAETCLPAAVYQKGAFKVSYRGCFRRSSEGSFEGYCKGYCRGSFIKGTVGF